MSMPDIPDIRPEINIDREKSVDLIIASVALEELALAHIINAEAEKIQLVLGTLENSQRTEPPTIDEILEINKIVERILKKVLQNIPLSLLEAPLHCVPPAMAGVTLPAKFALPQMAFISVDGAVFASAYPLNV